MALRYSRYNENLAATKRHISASCARELAELRRAEIRLRRDLGREEVLLQQKEELTRQQEVLSKETPHRLLNALQIVVSLLSLQSRASENAEAAAQLAIAANRVATIGLVHRHLHSLDGVETVAFKQYLDDLCNDLSLMLSPQQPAEQFIVVEAMELKLRSTIGIPLGYIVNELIMNAAKHGRGRISVSLKPSPGKGYSVSVSNDGPSLPKGFDPAACNGLGMRVIKSFVERIGGELRFGRGDNDQGARFEVLFS
jgi:two-component sensor histidine kinase